MDMKSLFFTEASFILPDCIVRWELLPLYKDNSDTREREQRKHVVFIDRLPNNSSSPLYEQNLMTNVKIAFLIRNQNIFFAVFLSHCFEEWSLLRDLHPHEFSPHQLEAKAGLSLSVQTHCGLVRLLAKWLQTWRYASTEGDILNSTTEIKPK